MKAIHYNRYGPPEVLELIDTEPPPIGDHEVLVRVHAAAVNAADWHLLVGKPWLVRLFAGLFKPDCKIPGADAAGTVETVGKNVTRFQPGNAVFGTSKKRGAFAEYMALHEDELVAKPTNVSHEEAAAVPTAGLAALQGMRDFGHIQPGQRVLINGAAGGVGHFAIQIARIFDADVTAVCSTRNLGFVRSLGASHTIDYTREEFTQSGNRYDLILDLVGNRPLKDCQGALAPEGIYVAAAGTPARMLRTEVTGGKNMKTMMSKPNLKDLEQLADYLATGQLKPAIERRYALKEVPGAIRSIGEGHGRGKDIVTL